MQNKKIAKVFSLTASLMELHDQNPQTVKAFQNVYIGIRNIEEDLASLDYEGLKKAVKLPKTMVDKVAEILENGTLSELEVWKSKTPSGILQMLSIKGLGPKKIQVIWKEMGVETVGDLLLACEENRLTSVKGFGQKTQDDIKNKLVYFFDGQGKYLYATVKPLSVALLKLLHDTYPDDHIELVGEVVRQMEEVRGIELLSTIEIDLKSIADITQEDSNEPPLYHGIPVFLTISPLESFGVHQLRLNSSSEFLEAAHLQDNDQFAQEQDFFERHQASFVLPAYRETARAWEQAKTNTLPRLIKASSISGVVHTHTTYSDGMHSIEQMAQYAQEKGYDYLVITDHSKAAFYANGLSIERLEMQWREIEKVQQKFPEIRILKGIESDILGDGSLDYPDEILQCFDVVIGSIHSNLTMDIEKATNRLLKAIGNPYTHILGHVTGRLLLGRPGYPVDMQKIMDACIDHNVVIELNANPNRLDIDWRHLEYFIAKNGKISINPDAHSREQMDYIHFGVAVAQKAGIEAKHCINCNDVDGFLGSLRK